jgi:phage internal scaffolding protein
MATFRKPYTRKRFKTVIEGESMTKQSFKDESDINFIMQKYQQTGYLNPDVIRDSDYFDASNALNFQDAMNIVVNAQDSFDALPSHIRKRFANDPALFLDFVGDEKNEDELRELGLLPRLTENETSTQAVPASGSNDLGDPGGSTATVD